MGRWIFKREAIHSLTHRIIVPSNRKPFNPFVAGAVFFAALQRIEDFLSFDEALRKHRELQIISYEMDRLFRDPTGCTSATHRAPCAYEVAIFPCPKGHASVNSGVCRDAYIQIMRGLSCLGRRSVVGLASVRDTTGPSAGISLVRTIICFVQCYPGHMDEPDTRFYNGSMEAFAWMPCCQMWPSDIHHHQIWSRRGWNQQFIIQIMHGHIVQLMPPLTKPISMGINITTAPAIE